MVAAAAGATRVSRLSGRPSRWGRPLLVLGIAAVTVGAAHQAGRCAMRRPPDRTRFVLPAAGLVGEPGFEVEGPCDSVPAEQWRRVAIGAGAESLMVAADGPHGNGRYWTISRRGGGGRAGARAPACRRSAGGVRRGAVLAGAVVNRTVVFLALVTLAAYASRKPLRRPGSHGFYRFFAWSSILGLLVVSFRGLGPWFADPLSLRQLGSWVLLGGSLVPLWLGTRRLLAQGQPDARTRQDPTLFPIEQTTRLVTTGIYRYIRHPIYTSLLLLTYGVFLKQPSWAAAGLSAVATGFLVATAIAEERENAGYFGPSYEAYAAGTKRFIPFLF